MDLKVEKIPPYRVAYIRHVGPYGTGNMKTMESLKNWAKSKNLFHAHSILLGIAHDNPETTIPEYCRYDTCVVVPEGYCIDNGFVCLGNISGGKYAVSVINHTAEAVQRGWLEIFTELCRLGYQLDETRPILERYQAELVNNHCCEICVPIQ